MFDQRLGDSCTRKKGSLCCVHAEAMALKGTEGLAYVATLSAWLRGLVNSNNSTMPFFQCKSFWLAKWINTILHRQTQRQSGCGAPMITRGSILLLLSRRANVTFTRGDTHLLRIMHHTGGEGVRGELARAVTIVAY